MSIGFCKKIAFTLAEVLITLTIIGVIAALTIPNLMRKWEDSQTVSGVKEAYSILNNAIKLAIQENGPLEEWYTKGNWFVTQEIAKHVGYRKLCQANDFSCSGNYGFKHNNNTCTCFKNLKGGLANSSSIGYVDCYDQVPPKIILNNNMIVAVSVGSLYAGRDFFGSYIRVDINGAKGPNRFGYDVFFFQLSKAGIEPYLLHDTVNSKRNCNIYWAEGTSCSAYVIKHGNVDYKYRDVSAEW